MQYVVLQVCGMQACPGCRRNANDVCAGFRKRVGSDESQNTNMEVDATWLDTSTYPDTMRDTQIVQEPARRSDEKPRQVSQEGTANEVREEHEEVRRELRPQLLFRWQATTEVETLTEQPAGPALHWAARAQEKRVGRLLTHLADAVTVTKQALGSNWEWQTHCKLWATPQILLRTPLSSGEDETNPCKGKIDAVREVADRCKYPGCETQVLAGTGVAEGDEKTEKEIRKLVMEEPAGTK